MGIPACLPSLEPRSCFLGLEGREADPHWRGLQAPVHSCGGNGGWGFTPFRSRCCRGVRVSVVQRGERVATEKEEEEQEQDQEEQEVRGGMKKEQEKAEESTAHCTALGSIVSFPPAFRR